MSTRTVMKRLMQRARCGPGVGPLAKLTDDELRTAVANLRAGRPSGINLGALCAIDPRISAMSDDEIVRRLAALRVQLAHHPQQHRMEE